MMTCDQCGNHYDKTFRVSMSGRDYNFDCFECAIAKLAPVCAHCDCRVIGHGVEQGDVIYCCAHCASASGVTGLADRPPEEARSH